MDSRGDAPKTFLKVDHDHVHFTILFSILIVETVLIDKHLFLNGKVQDIIFSFIGIVQFSCQMITLNAGVRKIKSYLLLQVHKKVLRVAM